jgi:thioesterase domain-containing protein
MNNRIYLRRVLLEQQGETVALLAILDTSAPDTKPTKSITDYTEIKCLSEIVSIFAELSGIDLKNLRGFKNLAGLPDSETAYSKVMQTFIERQILFALAHHLRNSKHW